MAVIAPAGSNMALIAPGGSNMGVNTSNTVLYKTREEKPAISNENPGVYTTVLHRREANATLHKISTSSTDLILTFNHRVSAFIDIHFYCNVV